MKVLELIEILKQYQQADKAVGGYISEPLEKTIKELEEIATIIMQQTVKKEFEVGDWVVYTGGGYCDGEILQITNIDEKGFCSFGNYNKLYHIKKLRQWEPKPDEWCWVCDNKTQIPYLRKFVRIDYKTPQKDSEGNVIASFQYMVKREDKRDIISYKHIEPFIGVLPSTIEQYWNLYYKGLIWNLKYEIKFIVITVNL